MLCGIFSRKSDMHIVHNTCQDINKTRFLWEFYQHTLSYFLNKKPTDVKHVIKFMKFLLSVFKIISILQLGTAHAVCHTITALLHRFVRKRACLMWLWVMLWQNSAIRIYSFILSTRSMTHTIYFFSSSKPQKTQPQTAQYQWATTKLYSTILKISTNKSVCSW